MDTKFWTLFRPRSTAHLEAQGHSYRYESLAAGEAPVVGKLPVRGNGPSILDLYRQGKNATDRSDRQERFRAVLNDEPAPPRPVPMTTEVGISRRNSTRTLGRRLSVKSIAKVKDKLPSRKKELHKGKSSPDLKTGSETRSFSVPRAALPIYDYNRFEDKPLPKIPKSKAKVKTGTGQGRDVRGHRRKSTHIDLFDAVQISKMRESQKNEAGKRNYGEDVADRNIEMYTPESRRTSVDSRHHNRGSSDAGIAYSERRGVPKDADWLNQPWVKEGAKPWEEVRTKDRRASGARSTRSVRSLRMDVEGESNWPIRNEEGARNRARSDAGKEHRVAETAESPDDESFELGAVTVSDDIFYPG